jgi:hypothetical protein
MKLVRLCFVYRFGKSSLHMLHVYRFGLDRERATYVFLCIIIIGGQTNLLHIDKKFKEVNVASKNLQRSILSHKNIWVVWKIKVMNCDIFIFK